MTNLKKIELSILFGLLFSVALSLAGFEDNCRTIKEGIFRLRVIANSDSEQDQSLKLAVRDEILKSAQVIFADCENSAGAKQAAKDNIKTINAAVNRVLNDNNSVYSFESAVRSEYFGIREYEDFTLPAGEYNSLVITLGKGEGHNWWCVLFPGVCLPAADNEGLFEVLDNDAADIVYNSARYKYRFKVAEIYEKIKEKCKKNKK